MFKQLSSTALVLSILTGCGAAEQASQAQSNDDAQQLSARQQLGQQLYFDPNLSANRTQACATCHDPATGFVDSRDNGVGGAVSLGDDGHSLGDRTAPTAAYAMFSPEFHLNKEGKWVGGQFWDGRASSLADQAAGPPTNPIEMGMASKAATVERIKQNSGYVQQFKAIYGDGVLDDADRAYRAMAESIGEFERTEYFAPFDSKYDRFLRGEYKMTPQEELGRTLFFSQQFTNCNQCHQLKTRPGAAGETFTNYQFHNIGVPANIALRKVNGVGVDFVDAGLLNNPQVTDGAEKGKYKVPTLRNVAVTGPYMHNGVFKDLRTVVLFYDKYNSRAARRQVNPETGQAWGQPEVTGTLSMKELESGPALDDRRVDALVAFMKTLTDLRYEDQL
ncbi:MAG: methylamine utilization protein MauG [Marinobacterium sp.]|nr:methylamine utilization protein MauG [Marinobacterium sp.]